MTLQQLKYFRVMAQVLHYTRASELLFISQSSLSYSIASLEKELGASLFHKNGKKTSLTEYGVEFLPFVERSLESLSEGVLHIEKMQAPTTVISLGYIYSLSFDFLPQTLGDFRKQTGNSEITFSFFQGLGSIVLEKLKRAELDLAFSVEIHDEQIQSLPVYEQDLFVVVPKGHPLIGKAPVHIDDIKEEKFITINPDSSLRAHLDRVFRSNNIIPNVVFEAAECNAMASFVGEGFGIAIMPEIPALRAYDVEVLPIADRQLVRSIHLSWIDGRPLNLVAERFRDYFIERAAQLGMRK